ncbi:MAG TPA: Gfo/Idh/MocA family oxidoreductase [Sumerlaeia bacterium]|nr:Gfo/Idh/MocA family oxidoreductase [Sumerlaeia bacterium]
MSDSITRRRFLAKTATSVAAATLAGAAHSSASAEAKGEASSPKPVRIGVAGVGGRGTGLLGQLLRMKGLEFPAVCDIYPDRVLRAQSMVERAGHPKPEGYSESETIYEKMMERDDLDAVLIASYWQWHTPMAVSAMRNMKYAAVEVPAALTLEECWDLVNTSEETGVPCMMLENWSFRQDNLAVLNMIRQGLLGEIVHCHCAHSHDCIDHWFFDSSGNDRWPAEFLAKRNCDQYPTHSVGPVLSWMDINCGDNFATLTSTASASKGINAYFTRRFGPDHPNAKKTWKQGDIVTTVVCTHQGKTLVIDYDMQLPRPYDNRWLIQGTLGLYNEQRESVYITGRSPNYHQWEPFAPYQDEFNHPWWKKEIEGGGHGGVDYLELELFVDAVRRGVQTPIDVYDSATMSSIVALSEQSIAQGSAPVQCPDFTRGRWKTRNPAFALSPAKA